MSDIFPSGLAEEHAEHLFAARYYILASVVVLYYDWLLTVPSEIERFWKLKLTGPGCLFMLNRYFPIICVIFEMIGFFTDTFSHEVCVNCANHVVPFIVAVNLISQSLIGIVLLLRTYALYQRSNTILLLISTAWALGTVAGIVAGSCIAPLTLPPGIPGCLIRIPEYYKHRVAAAYSALLVYETMIYVLTLRRTLIISRASRNFTISGDTLVGLILRDGSIYFMALLGATSLSILLIYLAPPDLQSLNTTFNFLIPVTIISRMLLNLQHDVTVATGRSAGPITSNGILTTDFNLDIMSAIIGNIGQDFEHGEDPMNLWPETRHLRDSDKGNLQSAECWL